MRITAQLIKAEDGYHLWSETYDRQLADIFTIQDEIAAAVTTALGVTLGAGDFGQPGMTRNIEAYDEYLRAVSLINELNPDSRLTAIDQAERVVSIDPSYALGWLAVRSAYIGGSLLLPPEQTTDFEAKVVAALERARAIAPDMPELLVIRAGEHQANGNWLEAERNLRQLLDQYGHSNEAANLRYGDMLLQVGRLQEVLPFLQRAQRLEPLSAETSWILSVTLLSLGRIEEAVAEAKRGLRLGGFEMLLNGVEWSAAFSASDIPRAAEIIETFYSMEGDNPDEYMLRLTPLLVSEDTEAALSEVRSMVADPTLSPFNKVILISFASVLGDPELTLDIYREYGLGSYRPLFFNFFRDIRQLPGFKTFVSDAGLVDYWRDSGKWSDFCHPVGEDDFECD